MSVPRPAADDYDLSPYLRRHLERSFVLSRNIMLVCLVFGWLTYWAGLHVIDMPRLTPLILLAIATHVVMGRIVFRRFHNRQAFLFLDGFLKCFYVTIAIWVIGGAGTGPVAVFYVIPIVYHSLTRGRRDVFITANIAVALYAGLMALECWDVIPRQNVFGFGKPPPITYLSLVLIMFFNLNVVAAVCSYVARTFVETAVQVEQANAALAQKNLELESRVAQRTRALADKARALEERQEDLRAFIYAVTHDLKGPLSNILLGADIVLGREGGALSGEGRDDLARIVRMAEEGEAMTEDLLELFRITSAPEEAGWVDLDELATQVLDTLRGQIEAKAVRVQVGPLPRVWGQAGKLRHLLTNLVGNAVKFVPAGAGRVEVSGAAENGHVLLRVGDNGIGIAADFHAGIFDLFKRVPIAERIVDGVAVGGTGVGLAVVKRIVEAHGGMVWVESAPGAGARFSVRLPAGPA
jgi:signal transduction histidine kinase